MNCVCCGQKVITDKHHPYMKYCSSKCSAKGQEARQRELLTDRIVKRHLYITSKGKLKYNHITQDMIVEKRAGLLERRKRIATTKAVNAAKVKNQPPNLTAGEFNRSE